MGSKLHESFVLKQLRLKWIVRNATLAHFNVVIKDIIEKLDVRRLQVLIEAAIVEVTADVTRQLGTELFVANTSPNNKTIPIGLTAPSGTLAQVLQGIALGTQQPVDLGSAPLIAAGRENNKIDSNQHNKAPIA